MMTRACVSGASKYPKSPQNRWTMLDTNWRDQSIGPDAAPAGRSTAGVRMLGNGPSPRQVLRTGHHPPTTNIATPAIRTQPPDCFQRSRALHAW